MREIIKVKNVSKVYKINKRKSGLFGAVLNLFAPRYEKKIAVSDMNFSIEEGEAVAFIEWCRKIYNHQDAVGNTLSI